MRRRILSRATVESCHELFKGFPAGPVLNPQPVERPQIKQPFTSCLLVNRAVPDAVGLKNFGRESLSRFRGKVSFAEQPAVRMVVNIDKSRSDDQSRGVDRGFRRCLGQIANGGDPVAGHSDVCPSARAAGPIDQCSAANNQVKHTVAPLVEFVAQALPDEVVHHP